MNKENAFEKNILSVSYKDKYDFSESYLLGKRLLFSLLTTYALQIQNAFFQHFPLSCSKM